MKWLYCIILVLSFGSVVFAENNLDTRYDPVFEEYSKTLKHLDEVNPPLMVFISGSFGMGKTEIAKKIEERFHGIRLNGDCIRDLLVGAGFNRGEGNSFFTYAFSRLHQISNNRLFIIDRTFDDNKEYYKNLIEEYGSSKFVIRLNVPKEIAFERVIKRGYIVDFLLSAFEDSYSKYLIGQAEEFDFILDNSLEDVPLSEELFEKIDSKLKVWQ